MQFVAWCIIQSEPERTETEKQQAVVTMATRRRGRHRLAVDKFMREGAEGDPVQVATLRGLADRWDEIERSGEGLGQVPQLAGVLLNAAEKLRIPHVDALAELERELGGIS